MYKFEMPGISNVLLLEKFFKDKSSRFFATLLCLINLLTGVYIIGTLEKLDLRGGVN